MRQLLSGRHLKTLGLRHPRGPGPCDHRHVLHVSCYGRVVSDLDGLQASAQGKTAWPKSVGGTLLALRSIDVARTSPQEQAAIHNRFPFRDEFTLAEGGVVSSAEVVDVLCPLITLDRLAKIRQVSASRTFSVIPVVEGLSDRGNLGAVCRTADALGYGSVYLAGLDGKRYRAARGRTSAGAEKWLNMQAWQSSRECLLSLRESGYKVVVTAPGRDAMPLQDWDWTQPTAVVMGNEQEGVSEEAIRLADASVTIPMAPGFVESFNVSVAAALVLYEARATRIRMSGRHADVDDGQQQMLEALMMLRHKGCMWQDYLMKGVLNRRAGLPPLPLPDKFRIAQGMDEEHDVEEEDNA